MTQPFPAFFADRFLCRALKKHAIAPADKESICGTFLHTAQASTFPCPYAFHAPSNRFGVIHKRSHEHAFCDALACSLAERTGLHLPPVIIGPVETRFFDRRSFRFVFSPLLGWNVRNYGVFLKDPAAPNQAAQLSLETDIARLTPFHHWICAGDMHEGNLIVSFKDREGYDLQVYSCDHKYLDFVDTLYEKPNPPEGPRVSILARSFKNLNALSLGFRLKPAQETAVRIENLPDRSLWEAIEEATHKTQGYPLKYLKNFPVNELYDKLRLRRDGNKNLPEIVQVFQAAHLQKIPSLYKACNARHACFGRFRLPPLLDSGLSLSA